MSEIHTRSILVISTIFDKMNMKSFFYFFIVLAFFVYPVSLFSQNINDTSLPDKRDTNKPSATVKLNDSNKKNKTGDSLKSLKKQVLASKPASSKKDSDTFSSFNVTVLNQNLSDSSDKKNNPDSLINIPVSQVSQAQTINKLLEQNRFINIKDAPVYFIEEERNPIGKEFLFYSLCTVILILGVFKTIYNGYFKNLFRVYFNTSLRQTQLADQLLQAKLPSFILNIFFALTAGIYIWLLFNHYHPPRLISHKILLPFCIISVALIYFIKFCLLKFMGWVSDIRSTTDNYVFAIFMVNKITGIFLLPVIIMLAFIRPEWFTIVANLSFMMLGLFFLSRYVKSYAAVEKKLTLTPFHFILYILGAEIIPLMIIYKVATDYLI